MLSFRSIVSPDSFGGGGGRNLWGFFFRPKNFAKLNQSARGWAFLTSELGDVWVEWAELCMIPSSRSSRSSSRAARGSCYCLFQGDQTAFLFGNPLRHSCWFVTWASPQLTYPAELNAVFWLPSWYQFKEYFNEDRWRMLDHYFKTWQITDWACFPAITANCIGTLECRGGNAEFHGFLYI